jgi:hypothetical protein
MNELATLSGGRRQDARAARICAAGSVLLAARGCCHDAWAGGYAAAVVGRFPEGGGGPVRVLRPARFVAVFLGIPLLVFAGRALAVFRNEEAAS